MVWGIGEENFGKYSPSATDPKYRRPLSGAQVQESAKSLRVEIGNRMLFDYAHHKRTFGGFRRTQTGL